jgi:hypothetical protein
MMVDADDEVRGRRRSRDREHRNSVPRKLHSCGCANRPHRTTHRSEVHRHTSRDVPDAPRADRAMQGRDHAYLSIWKADMHAVPALWNAKCVSAQDSHHLPARQKLS